MNEKTEFQDRNYLNKELKDMFFSLDLIQSYGSGIRRAKKAMEDNGSPKLVFEPNNETDDYTMVTAYISEEFARIKAEEERIANNGNSQNEPVNETVKLSEREKAIIQLMVENPIVTRTEMAERLQCSLSTIKRCITGLTEKEIIERVGSDKTGSWIVKLGD